MPAALFPSLELSLAAARPSPATLAAAAASGVAGSGRAPLALATRLRPSSREALAGLAAGAERKRKRYAASVWTSAPHTLAQLRAALEGRPPLAIAQRTPARVLHRRSLAVRPKTIHALALLHAPSPHAFTLALTSSAGAYIKEFVHGDCGRTRPSLGCLLGCEVDIAALDVVELLMEEDDAASSEGGASEAEGGAARGGEGAGTAGQPPTAARATRRMR